MIIAGAAAWTVASCVRAQAPVRLAFVEAGTATANHHFLDAFVRGMHAQGYELGRDVVVDALWADGAVERFPALLAKAIAYDPRVIVVASTPGALAAKAATARIPIVFVGVSDPFQRGLVESLARPAGNVTGLSAGDIGTIAKLVGYLRELLPKARRMAVVWNPNGIEARMRGALEAIHSLNLEGAVLQVRRSEDFTDAFAAMQAQAFDAFVAVTDPLTLSNRLALVSLAAQHRIPGGYEFPEFARAGGLLAYSANVPLLFERAAIYVDKILRGASPSDLPVEQPTAYQLAINLHAARELGLVVPAELMLSADEVIR
jgi:putative ABC transport system substrate-binding protein